LGPSQSAARRIACGDPEDACARQARQVVFRGLSDGTVVIAKKEPRADDGDPVIGRCLAFLAHDMGIEPARIRPVPRSMVSRGKALIKALGSISTRRSRMTRRERRHAQDQRLYQRAPADHRQLARSDFIWIKVNYRSQTTTLASNSSLPDFGIIHIIVAWLRFAGTS
jgi:hypothetical protein